MQGRFCNALLGIYEVAWRRLCLCHFPLRLPLGICPSPSRSRDACRLGGTTLGWNHICLVPAPLFRLVSKMPLT